MRIYAVYFLFLPLLSWRESKAQQNILKPDQNPRYIESAQHYRAAAGTLLNTEGVTLQQTYKAYDWYEVRMELRQQRNRRHLHRYSDRRLFYFHGFSDHYYRDYPYFQRPPRHRYFPNTLPHH